MLVVFASTIFTRAVDPVIPTIAADLAVDVHTAALLSSAFTFPYALMQPLMGSIADHFGKTRLMTLSLLVVALSSLVCAVASGFPVLIAMRVLAGCVAGGLFPVALALVGDLVPVEQRQVALGRLLAVGLSGNLLGSTFSGVISDLVGWRGVFAVFGLVALAITIIAMAALRGGVPAKRTPYRLASMFAGFRNVLTDPRAKVCFGSVFLEGVFIHGLFPYVALLLPISGGARASIAGLVIACFSFGGVAYSMSVRVLVAKIVQQRLMIIGGTFAAIGLSLVAWDFPWQAQIPIFFVLGFGFYLLHSCIQVHVTDLSHTARGSATALHSSSLFLGQATGPIFYGFSFAHDARTGSILVGALVMLGVGIMCARLLRHREAA